MCSINFLGIASTLLPLMVLAAGPLERELTQQTLPKHLLSTSNHLKVPGESPAYYCSDPSDDIFQIRRLDFTPTNVRMFVPPPHAPNRQLH